jgi:hypothetical protein
MMKVWAMMEVRYARMAVGALLILLLGGCVTDEDKMHAISASNESFRIDYEKILADKGTREYKVRRDDAFVAMRVTMAGLGMRTESQDASLGHLIVVAPAPLPLDDAEWLKASNADTPLLRKIIDPYVGGFSASFVHFEPQGLNIVIGATFVDTGAGTEISLTARLREVAPPRSGWPRREYLLPTAVSSGLDKIWRAFEQELRSGPQRP